MRRAPSIALFTSSVISASDSRRSVSQPATDFPFQVHERINSVVDSALSNGRNTSCVEITKTQSERLWKSVDIRGDAIDRCKCRSGSSIMITAPGSAVSTLVPIRMAFRSPSESSAMLYGALPSLLANNCSPFSMEMSIGRFAILSSSLSTLRGDSSFFSANASTTICGIASFSFADRAASKAPMSIRSAILRDRTLSALIKSKIAALNRWDP